MLKVKKGSGEEIPFIQCKEQQLHFAGTAMNRYPTSKVRGGQEEPPRAGGQGRRSRPGMVDGRSDTRSGGCAGIGGPRGAIPH